jgi:hypothetical protein
MSHRRQVHVSTPLFLFQRDGSYVTSRDVAKEPSSLLLGKDLLRK